MQIITPWLSVAIVATLALPSLLFAHVRDKAQPPAIEFLYALAIGTIIVLASLYPYWLFGSESAVGWYDEYDAIIPAYLLHLESISPGDFSHSFAGGTEVRAAYPDIGNAYVDLYSLLLAAFGGPLGSFVYRLFGMSLLYAGTFFTCRFVINASFGVAAICGLTAVFATAYPYAWTLGAYAWDFAIMVWLPLLLVVETSQGRRMALALGFGIVAATTVTPVFFIPWAALYLVLALLLLGRVSTALLFRSIPALIAVAGIVAINQLPNLLALFESLGDSGRFQRLDGAAALAALADDTASAVDLGDLARSVWAVIESTILFGLTFLTGRSSSLLGFPPTVIFTAITLVACIWFWVRRKSARALLVVLVPLVLGSALSFLGGLQKIPVVSAYRWDLLYVCIPFLSALVLAQFLADLGKSGTRGRTASWLTATFLLAVGVFGAGNLASRSVNELNLSGGWAVMTRYPALADLARAAPLARAVSLPGYYPKPMFGPHYGLDVLDGVRRNATWRRIAFWFETLPTTPVAKWHTHRHALGRRPEDVNFEALRLANVSIVMSTAQLSSAELRPAGMLPGMSLSDKGTAASRLLSTLFPGLHLAPDLFLYRLDGAWDRVFSPAQLIRSGVADFDIDYFRQLRSLPRHAVLVPANAPSWLSEATPSGLTVIAAEKSRTGITVKTGGQGGLLVYNQEHTKDWRATCGGNALPLAPVNAIMMVVSVPADCVDVTFSHGQQQAEHQPAG